MEDGGGSRYEGAGASRCFKWDARAGVDGNGAGGGDGRSVKVAGLVPETSVEGTAGGPVKTPTSRPTGQTGRADGGTRAGAGMDGEVEKVVGGVRCFEMGRGQGACGGCQSFGTGYGAGVGANIAGDAVWRVEAGVEGCGDGDGRSRAVAPFIEIGGVGEQRTVPARASKLTEVPCPGGGRSEREPAVAALLSDEAVEAPGQF